MRITILCHFAEPHPFCGFAGIEMSVAFGEDHLDHFAPPEHPIMTVWRGIPQPNQGGIDQGLSKDCLSRSEPV